MVAEIMIVLMAIICAFVIGWSKRKRYVALALIIYVVSFALLALVENALH